MLQNIVHPYCKKAVVYKHLRLIDFTEKLIEVFGEPTMAKAKLQQLSKAS